MSEIVERYRDIKPNLERLRKNVESVLSQVVNEKNIPIFAVESRIKDEESLEGKVVRKSYSSPLDEIDDLCGIRVICYYQEDIKSICEIVESEFHVVKKEDKKEALNDNQFGYTSHHYVVKLKKAWFAHPGARGLEGFRAEIQIRTMLMHTWAAISHKLLYKREADVPAQFKRQLNRLSALIELADEQFDAIKNVKIKLVSDLAGDGDVDLVFSELSSDALFSIYKKFFSDRRYDEHRMPDLLEEIRSTGLDYKGLVENVKRCLPILGDLEREEFGETETLPMWHFSGVIRSVLDLTVDDYFQARCPDFPDSFVMLNTKYRALLKPARKSK